MIIVAAALIQQDARLLICQRRRTDAFGLKWEFPGGKVQPAESAAEGLARELAEELGVTAAIGPEVYRTRHRYAEYSDELELVFFVAALNASEVRNLAFERIAWAELATLPRYDFLPADRELVSLISSGRLRLS
ncbi:MAG TPA: (deoxy)nucleoside triphosphate pyrophosphohydrolase [Candidatus Acidoferrales bacterium]|jgi:mutator protein MutT|nr:(deoxy)nucleoside triphosphate pyrophosphohydrolase [Candidatus Acidoferrales bacterium]